MTVSDLIQTASQLPGDATAVVRCGPGRSMSIVRLEVNHPISRDEDTTGGLLVIHIDAPPNPPAPEQDET